MDIREFTGVEPNLRRYLKWLEGQITGGYEVISTLEDFPTPVNGIITIEKDTNYNIIDVIELGNNRITSPSGSINFFTSPNPISTGILKYSGTESMFFDDGDGRILAFGLNGLQAPNGSIFDCGELGGTAGNSIVFDLSVISDTDQIGEIRNYGFYTSRSLAFVDCGQGLVLEDVENIRILGFQFDHGKNQVGAVALTIKGTTETLSITEGFVCTNANEKILNIIDGVGSGVVSGLIYDCTLGQFYETGSEDHSSIGMRVTGNIGIPNSSTIGGFNIKNNVTVTSLVAGVPKIIAGTTIASNANERFTHSSLDNSLTMTAKEETRVKISAAITLQNVNGNNRNYKFYIYKNGVDLGNSVVERRLTNTGEIGGCAPLQDTVTLQTGDKIQIFATVDLTNDIIVKHFNLSIVGGN